MQKLPVETAPSRATPLPIIVLMIGQLAVGSAAIMARFGLQSGLSSLSLAAWRLLLASAIVLISVRLSPSTKARETLTLSERGKLVLAGICLGLHFLVWFSSLEYISVARSTLLVATSPVWTGLFGTLVLKQRMGARFWVGLVMACLGGSGVTMFGPSLPNKGTEQHPFLGDVFALAGAVLVTAYYFLVEGVQRRHGTVRIISWTYTTSALTLCPIVLFASHTSIVPSNALGWWAVIGMALLPQMIGHTALNWSLLHFPAGVVGTATLLEPVFAGILAFLLFHEPVTSGQVVAAILLLCGVGITLWKPVQTHSDND